MRELRYVIKCGDSIPISRPSIERAMTYVKSYLTNGIQLNGMIDDKPVKIVITTEWKEGHSEQQR